MKAKAGASSSRPRQVREDHQTTLLPSVRRKGKLSLGGPPLGARAYKMKTLGVGRKGAQEESSSPVLSDGEKVGNGDIPNTDPVIEDSDSEEDELCFEIKKREPKKADTLSNQFPQAM
ncbi:unnamed protein product [Linum trigynum]|uniref:Uncharacterized protein n=1 Tax=Linum trigynum TaxID=586398 RepID=A0AAV2CHS7_9ROSI